MDILHTLDSSLLTGFIFRYESIRTVTKTPPKQKGQLGGMILALEVTYKAREDIALLTRRRSELAHEKSPEGEVRVFLPDEDEIARQRQRQMLEEDENLAQKLGEGRGATGLETSMLSLRSFIPMWEIIAYRTLLLYRRIYNGSQAD